MVYLEMADSPRHLCTYIAHITGCHFLVSSTWSLYALLYVGLLVVNIKCAHMMGTWFRDLYYLLYRSTDINIALDSDARGKTSERDINKQKT